MCVREEREIGREGKESDLETIRVFKGIGVVFINFINGRGRGARGSGLGRRGNWIRKMEKEEKKEKGAELGKIDFRIVELQE